MNNQTYEGWANRETWALVLHMLNNEGLLEWVQDTVGGARHDMQDALSTFWYDILDRKWWRDEMGSEMPDWADGARTDIGSLWRVEWAEVAEAYLEVVEG